MSTNQTSTNNTAGTSTNGTAPETTGAGAGVGGAIRNVFGVVHGAGETIRGNINSTFDGIGHGVTGGPGSESTGHSGESSASVTKAGEQEFKNSIASLRGGKGSSTTDSTNTTSGTHHAGTGIGAGAGAGVGAGTGAPVGARGDHDGLRGNHGTTDVAGSNGHTGTSTTDAGPTGFGSGAGAGAGTGTGIGAPVGADASGQNSSVTTHDQYGTQHLQTGHVDPSELKRHDGPGLQDPSGLNAGGSGRPQQVVDSQNQVEGHPFPNTDSQQKHRVPPPPANA